MKDYVRCPRCSRILFPTKENKLPDHRVPMRPDQSAYKPASVPLTGTGQPWCAGLG
jgi:DNA-directed RNA polymerase subunit RPC12/RpoP